MTTSNLAQGFLGLALALASGVWTLSAAAQPAPAPQVAAPEPITTPDTKTPTLSGDKSMTTLNIVQDFLGHVFAGRMDQALTLVAPDARFISTRPQPNPHNPVHGTFVGIEGAKQFFGGFGEMLEPGEFKVEAAFSEGEHAALYGTLRHKSRKTGKTFASDWALICTVKDGQLTLYHFYEDTEALRDALSPDVAGSTSLGEKR